MKLITKGITIFDQTLNILVLLAAVIVIFLLLMVNMEVIMRYFLARPVTGVIEIAEYSLLFITFLTAAWVLRDEGHVKMDIVLNMLKPRAKASVNVITSALCTLVSLILTFYGVWLSWIQFQTQYRLSTPLEPLSYLIIAIIPIGYFLLFIQFTRRTHGYVRELRLTKK